MGQASLPGSCPLCAEMGAAEGDSGLARGGPARVSSLHAKRGVACHPLRMSPLRALWRGGGGFAWPTACLPPLHINGGGGALLSVPRGPHLHVPLGANGDGAQKGKGAPAREPEAGGHHIWVCAPPQFACPLHVPTGVGHKRPLPGWHAATACMSPLCAKEGEGGKKEPFPRPPPVRLFFLWENWSKKVDEESGATHHASRLARGLRCYHITAHRTTPCNIALNMFEAQAQLAGTPMSHKAIPPPWQRII
jgi:hypothetical protein